MHEIDQEIADLEAKLQKAKDQKRTLLQAIRSQEISASVLVAKTEIPLILSLLREWEANLDQTISPITPKRGLALLDIADWRFWTNRRFNHPIKGSVLPQDACLYQKLIPLDSWLAWLSIYTIDKACLLELEIADSNGRRRGKSLVDKNTIPELALDSATFLPAYEGVLRATEKAIRDTFLRLRKKA